MFNQKSLLAKSISELCFTAFDFETTGLYAGIDRIIEIGAIKFRQDNICDRFHSLIDPHMPVSPEASRVNRITNKMLKGKPELAKIIPDFIEFIKGTVLIAHNARFDMGFLSHALKRLGLPAIDPPVLDTQRLSHLAFPGMRNYRLQHLASQLAIRVENSHRAMDDTRVCMEIFLCCVKNISMGEEITLDELLN